VHGVGGGGEGYHYTILYYSFLNKLESFYKYISEFEINRLVMSKQLFFKMKAFFFLLLLKKSNIFVLKQKSGSNLNVFFKYSNFLVQKLLPFCFVFRIFLRQPKVLFYHDTKQGGYYDSNQGSYCIMIRTREVIMIQTRELPLYEPERLFYTNQGGYYDTNQGGYYD
jgi:hypothetical protein